MVMVLTLPLYSVAEWLIRKRLKERNEFVPNQVNEPTQNPTLKWVFMDFMGVIEVMLNVSGEPERQLTNLNENARKIITIPGGRCENIMHEKRSAESGIYKFSVSYRPPFTPGEIKEKGITNTF